MGSPLKDRALARIIHEFPVWGARKTVDTGAGRD